MVVFRSARLFDVISSESIHFRTELLILWYSFVRTTEPKPKKRILTKEKSIFGRGGCVVLTKPPRSFTEGPPRSVNVESPVDGSLLKQ